MKTEQTTNSIEKLRAALADDMAQLLDHPLYDRINNVTTLRVFMASHVFAVWDFMSLLKSLQNQITCTEVPWTPRQDTASVRFINEIVVAEESDEVTPGQFMSHYELYLHAMKEVGADTAAVETFISRLSAGNSFENSIKHSLVPYSTKDFVRSTLELAAAPAHIAAAAFFYGREDIIPKMFTKLLNGIECEVGQTCENFRRYLLRHIVMDHDQHGPLAEKLLMNLCGDREENWTEALFAARIAIRARIRLWDGILEQLNSPLFPESKIDMKGNGDFV